MVRAPRSPAPLRFTARAIARVWAIALLALLVIPAVPAVTLAAAEAPQPLDVTNGPKVVVIVGPTGDATDSYRALGEQAAQAARLYTDNVITLYSPDATWGRVRDALQGASVVVYLGHGNGFPNSFRSDPWPYSENGLGLNVRGDLGDEDHQYFGEYYLARAVRLAPNAVVVLSHLCYASGTAEPGLPEASLKVAAQRVDNYAAGFIAAGASAVIAEGLWGPAYYVEQLLAGRGAIGQIWRDAPTFHGNVIERESRRSAGFSEYLDPLTADQGGYYRSLVVKRPMSARDMIDGANGISTSGHDPNPYGPEPPQQPELPPATFSGARLSGAPLAGSTVRVAIPIASGRDQLPDGVTFSVRWEPLTLDVPPPSEGGSGATNGITRPPEGDGAWIVPEAPQDAVQTDIAVLRHAKVTAHVQVPGATGTYRLTVGVSDADGVALPETQATQPTTYLVRVLSALGVRYDVPSEMDAVSGSRLALLMGLTNTGGAHVVAGRRPRRDQRLDHRHMGSARNRRSRGSRAPELGGPGRGAGSGGGREPLPHRAEDRRRLPPAAGRGRAGWRLAVQPGRGARDRARARCGSGAGAASEAAGQGIAHPGLGRRALHVQSLLRRPAADVAAFDRRRDQTRELVRRAGERRRAQGREPWPPARGRAPARPRSDSASSTITVTPDADQRRRPAASSSRSDAALVEVADQHEDRVRRPA